MSKYTLEVKRKFCECDEPEIHIPDPVCPAVNKIVYCKICGGVISINHFNKEYNYKNIKSMRRKVVFNEDPIHINNYEDLVSRIKGWHLFGVEMETITYTSYEGKTKETLKGVLKIDEHDNVVIVFLNKKHFMTRVVTLDFRELKDATICLLEDYDDLIKFLNSE